MAINYSAAVKTARMTVVLDAIDGAVTAGTLEIATSGYASVLATITLADPSGAVAGDTLSFTVPVSDVEADASGTAAVARVKDGDGNVVINNLTVGVATADVILDSTSITAGQTIQINSASIQHAA